MNTKSIVGGILGGVAFFLLGWLVWGIILHNVMAGYSDGSCDKSQEEISMVMMVVANLAWGLTMAYILSNWAGENNFSKGLKVGAIVSVAIGLSYDLFLITMTTMISSYAVIGVNVLANAVVGGIVGGIICWWLGRK